MEKRPYIFATCWLLLCLVSASLQQDTRGKKFYLGFLENDPSQTGVQLVLVTDSNIPAHVWVQSYDPYKYQWVTVVRGTPETLTIPSAIRGAGVEMSGKRVRITSDQEISVTAVNQDPGSTDAFLVFPTDALGTEYYAMTYTEQPELMVVATENNTDVTITFPNYADATVNVTYDGRQYGPGDSLTFTLILNEEGSFHVLDGSNGADFTGTRINSTKPVAVVSGNQKVKVPSDAGTTTRGHLEEMMPPVHTYGTEFFITSTPERTEGDIYRVLSATDNTTLTAGGNTYSMNAGEFVEINVTSGSYQYWTSTQPVLVAKFEKSGDGTDGGPSIVVVPHTDQYDTDYTWSTIQQPDGQEFENRISVAIATDQIAGLRLDGQSITWSGQQEYDIGGYTHLWASVSSGEHNLYHLSSNVTFMAAASGAGTDNSYAFLAGQRLYNPLDCTPTTGFPGDAVDNDCDGSVDEDASGDDLILLDRVDGEWGSWSDPGPCSVSCGSGYKTRTRECNVQGRGLYCAGNSIAIERCNSSDSCGPGPVCRNERQRCLAGYECQNSTGTCPCPSDQHGDGFFECAQYDRYLCYAEGDPHVHSFGGSVAPVTLPCWYRMGRIVTLASQSQAIYCEVDVQALNELTEADNLYYVRELRVTARFFEYGINRGHQYIGDYQNFTLSQEDIRTADGGDPWPYTGEVENNAAFTYSWDENDNFAILDVCDVRIKFRPYVPGEAIPMTFKPGLSISAPRAASSSDSFTDSVCGGLGGQMHDFERRAKYLALQNVNQVLIHSILRTQGVVQSDGNPDYHDQCSNGASLLGSCPSSRVPLALRLCTIIMNSEFRVLRCLMDNGHDPMTVFNHCLDWVCNKNSCDNYRDPIVDSDCPRTPLMVEIECSPDALDAKANFFYRKK